MLYLILDCLHVHIINLQFMCVCKLVHLIKQLIEDEVLAQQLVEYQITYSTIGRGHHACSTVGRGPTTCSTTGRGYRTCSTIGRGSYSLTGRGLFPAQQLDLFLDTLYTIQSQGYFALLTCVFRVIEGHKTLM